MKTLFALIVVALGIYYYQETHKEIPPPQVAAASTPTPRKVYYHSPLDAPAMSTNTHSGAGYKSSHQGTNWRGSHMTDGMAPRTAVADRTPDPDAE